MAALFRAKLNVLLLVSALLFSAVAPVGAEQRSIAFAHVNVVDLNSGQIQADMTVVVRGGRIIDVAKSDNAKVSKSTSVIDAQGKYLIPGLWDMHVHTAFGDWLPRNEKVTLPLFVANGVTGVRDMGGDLDVLKQWRSQTAAGTLLGPRMIIAGPMLDGPVPRFPSSASVANADDGRRVVDDLKNQTVDFIKIQSLIPRDGYFAAAEESKKLGLTFVGHVPDAVRASEASNAGQKSIEHFTGIFEGCSTIEDQLLKGPKSVGQNVNTY